MRRSRRRWYWLSPEERERRDVAILELYAMGRSYAEIGDAFGLTRQRIFQIVKERR
jgi:DNA-binding CsgD family transcriptional regulator